MDSVSEGMGTRRHVYQAYVGYWLAQTGTGYGTGSVHTDQLSLPPNPAERIVLRLRKTDLRNEGTPLRASCGAGANRMRGGRRIPQEAKAWGNAQDRLTWGRSP